MRWSWDSWVKASNPVGTRPRGPGPPPVPETGGQPGLAIRKISRWCRMSMDRMSRSRLRRNSQSGLPHRWIHEAARSGPETGPGLLWPFAPATPSSSTAAAALPPVGALASVTWKATVAVAVSPSPSVTVRSPSTAAPGSMSPGPP